MCAGPSPNRTRNPNARFMNFSKPVGSRKTGSTVDIDYSIELGSERMQNFYIAIDKEQNIPRCT